MSAFLTHGRILGGVATTPDLDAALFDYRDRLGLRVVDNGTLPADLAASWGCPANAGARFVTLQPASGVPCFLRLVEQALPTDFVPTRTYGWAAYELTVQDVFGWPERLAGSGFDIIGPPREIPGLPYFVALQMLGRGRELIYLNEVRMDTPAADLPRAATQSDHLFIVILATPDCARTLGWYETTLGLQDGGTYTLPYSMINTAFGLPPDTLSTISMAQVGRLPIVEIDEYPAGATARRVATGGLPPGNALVTLAVDRFAGRKLDFLVPPTVRQGPFYAGRRTGTVVGPAGELLELVELD